jgi:hypothetical protein
MFFIYGILKDFSYIYGAELGLAMSEDNKEKKENTLDLKKIYNAFAEGGGLQWLHQNTEISQFFTQLLATLSGFLGYGDGTYKFPEVSKEQTREAESKAERKLTASGAVESYKEAIDDNKKQIEVTYDGDTKPTKLTLMDSVNDPKTGFKGAIYMDDNGHAVVFYGGMSEEGNDRRHGNEETLVQASLKGQVNEETGEAQALYLKAVSMSKSTEIVGYSLGSMLANDMAARFNAKSTNIADIGLPDVKGKDGQSLYTEEQKQNIKNNVVSLEVSGDPLIASAGTVYGQQQTLAPVKTQDILTADNKEPAYKDIFNGASDGRIFHSIESYLLSAEQNTPGTAVVQNTPKNAPKAA